jgi:hypothetical protein
LGFVIVVVWQEFQSAASVAAGEASSLGDVQRIAQGYPNPSRERIVAAVRTYTQVVVSDEWAAMSERRDSTKAWNALTELWRTCLAVQSTTPAQNALYAQTLIRLDDVGHYRRQRLLASETHIPGVLWAALLLGALIAGSCGYLFRSGTLWTYAVLTSAQATMIALVLLVILTLDYPFRGDTRVSPAAFQQVLQINKSLAHP